MLRAVLDLPSGLAVRIGVDGLLIGRHRSCDIQLTDATASRHHALLRIAPTAVELVVLGRKPVDVNSEACTTVRELVHGDRVSFPGFEATLRVERREQSVAPAYVLRRGQARLQISASPFIIGDGSAAHVVIAGWPDEALQFSTVQGVLLVEVAAPGGTVNGRELPDGTLTELHAGDELDCRGEIFTIEHAGAGELSTQLSARPTAPIAVALHPLPRGGRITFTFLDGNRTVYVPGRRYQLLAALLSPPPPHAIGDYIPDAELVPLVWNDNDEVGGRQDINVLLTRCRQDLVAAGIAATSLLERAPGGRATRIVLMPGATVRTSRPCDSAAKPAEPR